MALPALVLLLIVARHLADAEAVGLTLAHALVSKLHRKVATMCQHLAVEADFIGILLLALAVLAVRLRHRAQEQQEHQAVHARQDTIGCLTAADGACLMAQQVAQLQQVQLDLHQQLQRLRLRLLLRQQLQLLSPARLLLQANLYRLHPAHNGIRNFPASSFVI